MFMSIKEYALRILVNLLPAPSAPMMQLHCLAKASVLAATLCVPFAASSSWALTPAQEAYLKKLDAPILLRGDYFNAVMAAYKDFADELAKNAAAAKSADTPNKQLADWLSKIEHFDIQVEQTKESFIVEFGPTVRGNFLPVLGGGARYVIDRNTFTITSRIFSK
jgi:hypothetical protein